MSFTLYQKKIMNSNTQKASHKEYKPDDSFSNLPDEIICRIISFLPSESTLQTSFVCTRWRDLWNRAIVSHGSTAEDFSKAIAGFLAQFDEKDPLRYPCRLQYHIGQQESVVLLAAVAPNNKLHLDMSNAKRGLEFGWNLKLINYQTPQSLITNQSCPFTFCVKTLHLKGVSYLTSEAISSLVSNLESLESLNIMECEGLRSLCIESNKKLVKLAILDCLELNSIHLRCSKLKSFRYRGALPWIWPEHHFNLADAMLDFSHGPGYSNLHSEDFVPPLLTIKNSQFLTLCRWTFEALIWPSISPICGNFKFYNLKELWWIDNSPAHGNDALVSFLRICPALERLNLIFDPESYCIPNTKTWLKQVITCQEDKIFLSIAEDLRQQAKLKHLNIEILYGVSSKDMANGGNGNFLKTVKQWSKGNELSFKLAKEVDVINKRCPKHDQTCLYDEEFITM